MMLSRNGLVGFILFLVLIVECCLVVAQTHRTLPPTLSPTPNPDQSNQENYNPLKNCVPPEDPTPYQNRLKEYQTALEDDPDNPYFLRQLGNLHSRLLEWDKAQSFFFKALTHNKDANQISEIYRQLGDLYACQQQFDKAIAQYKRSIRSHSQASSEHNSDVKHNLALTQLLAQQQKKEPPEDKPQNQQKENPQQKRNPTEAERDPKDSAQQNPPQQKQPSQKPSSTAQKENKPEEEQNSSEDKSEDQMAKPDPSKKKEPPNEEETSQSLAKNSEDQEGQPPNKDSQSAFLSRQQAEQLLNSVSENRQKFIQRLLKRQPTPPSTGKNW